MLTPPEIAEVAVDFKEEVRKRKYVEYIMAAGFVEDPHAWEMVIEVMEVILHRRDLYIVPHHLVKDEAAPRINRTRLSGEPDSGPG